jgi:hypothetical protein
MKKILVIVATLFILLSCTEEKHTELGKLTITEQDTLVGFANYTIPEAEARKMFKNFRSKFRECDDENMGHTCDPKANMNDSLTKSVWMSRKAMLNLFAQFLGDSKLDGLRFYIGAYDKKHPEIPGNCHNDQVSIVIVPTRYVIPINPRKSYHVDDWDYFQKYLNSLTAKQKQHFSGGFNHGELCPDVCN